MPSSPSSASSSALGALATLRLPAGAESVIDGIRDAGGQAYLVGGAVRDALLGRAIRDWDFATDLPPTRLAELFRRTHLVGAQFGTVLVSFDDETYQVTTFRRDGVYVDSRHPESVEFTDSIEEDLTRRDFTINALAYDPRARRLVDPSGGRDDLQARRLRAVGDPETRFREDGLRLLRAVRLASQLEFEIDLATLRALVLCAPGISRISPERVREELTKLLELPRPSSGLLLLLETGLLRRVLPELDGCYGVTQNPHHAYDVFFHSLAAVDRSPADRPVVRLAALYHDIGKPVSRVVSEETATFYGHQFDGERLADALMRRLRYPTDERTRVAHLVRHHMFHYMPEWTDGAVRRFLRQIGPENLSDLVGMRAADTLGNGLRRRLAPEVEELQRRCARVLEQENALSVRDLAVGGADLMRELDLAPGPIIGRLLHHLLELVLEEPELNTRDALLGEARKALPGTST